VRKCEEVSGSERKYAWVRKREEVEEVWESVRKCEEV
jgi:hypothetical protein